VNGNARRLPPRKVNWLLGIRIGNNDLGRSPTTWTLGDVGRISMTFDVSFRKQKMQVKSETPLPGSPAVNPELVRYSQLVNNWLLTTRLDLLRSTARARAARERRASWSSCLLSSWVEAWSGVEFWREKIGRHKHHEGGPIKNNHIMWPNKE